MLRRSLIALSLLWPLASHAQDIDLARFTPFDVGDRWEYQYTRHEWFWSEEDEPTDSTATLLGFLTIEVTADTLIDGNEYRILARRQYNESRSPVGSSSCAAPIFQDGSSGYYDEGKGICNPESWLGSPFYPLPPRHATSEVNLLSRASISMGDEIVIGGSSYPVPAAVRLSYALPHDSQIFYYAADVGLYRWEYWQAARDPTGSEPEVVLRYDLVYARVGDSTYGTTGVGREPTHPPSSPSALSVKAPYPNPSTEEAHVPVFTGVPGNAVVEVFDTSGRRLDQWTTQLHTGETTLQLDVRKLASGIYLVRVTDARGRSSSTSLLKL